MKKKRIGIWEIKRALTKRNSGYHKTHPEICCKGYKKTVWVDANINILTGYLSSILNKTKNKILTTTHYERNCIYDELTAIQKAKRDNVTSLKKCHDFFVAEKMPKHYGLNETCIIYRKISNDLVLQINQMWWNFIKNYSKRDQASFSYVLYKYNIKPQDISIPNARKDCKNFYFFNHMKKNTIDP